MPIVKYTDDDGLVWMVAVPDGERAEYGAILGPPDFSPLGLSEEDTKKLHNALIEHGLYNAPQLMGKRAILQRILTELNLREHLRSLISLFQREYYGEE